MQRWNEFDCRWRTSRLVAAKTNIQYINSYSRIVLYVFVYHVFMIFYYYDSMLPFDMKRQRDEFNIVSDAMKENSSFLFLFRFVRCHTQLVCGFLFDSIYEWGDMIVTSKKTLKKGSTLLIPRRNFGALRPKNDITNKKHGRKREAYVSRKNSFPRHELSRTRYDRLLPHTSSFSRGLTFLREWF